MRTIIAGSRGITELSEVEAAIQKSGFQITCVISGTAQGVDTLGEEWAAKNNIPVELYPANWNKYGKSAGYKRNQLMANEANALIAVWDGVSKGTSHMINIARAAGLKVYVYLVNKTPS